MRHDIDRAIADLGASQHGIVDRRSTSELGADDDLRARRVSQGRLIELFEGVYRLAGAPVTWRGDLLAAVLAGRPTAVAARRSAAAVWGIDGGDTLIQEILCRRWLRSRYPGLIVHETKVLDARDVTVVDAIPVTTIERTLLDLGAVRHPLTVERAVETALRKELTTLPDLRATVRRLSARGRNGVGVLRRIIDERDPDRRLTESAMEMRLLQVLRTHGLPAPVTQHEIRDRGRLIARVDAAYPDMQIALEYESLDWHTGKAALLRDSARRNAIVAMGWIPVAVTVEDLRAGGDVVCKQITAIRQRFT